MNAPSRPSVLADAGSLIACPICDMLHREVSVPVGGRLRCQRCRLVYPIREGIPCMLPEEAQLPPGCASLDDLPCRKQPAVPPGGGA